MLLQAQLGWKLSGSVVQPTDRMWNGSGWVDQGRSMVTTQIKDTNCSVMAKRHMRKSLDIQYTERWMYKNTPLLIKVKLIGTTIHQHRQDTVGCGLIYLPLSWRMFDEDRLPPLKPPVNSRGVMMWEWDVVKSAALLLLGSTGHPVDEKTVFSLHVMLYLHQVKHCTEHAFTLFVNSNSHNQAVQSPHEGFVGSLSRPAVKMATSATWATFTHKLLPWTFMDITRTGCMCEGKCSNQLNWTLNRG